MDAVDDMMYDGDEGAKRLLSEYGGRLTAAAVVLCGDAARAEDLVAETIAIAVREIDKFRKEAPIFEWLYGIMQNRYRQAMRRKSATSEIPMADPHEESAEGVVDGAAQIEEAVDAAILRNAVEALPPDMREAVVLHYFMDMPILKIAKFIATPVGTVKSRLHYARMALQRRLGVKSAKPVVVLAAAALFLIASAAVVVAVSASESSTGRARSPSAPQPTVETPVAPVSAAGSSTGRARSPSAPQSTGETPGALVPAAESPTASTTQGENQMNTNKVTSALLGIAAATSAALPLAAPAATTITIDSVLQRWPWNNKVDITYTVGGGQNLAAGEYKKIVFTATINGIAYTIDGTTDVGASANAGTHTVTWTAPSGIKRTDCTMSAAVYAADAPSGDDYMIIDLNTGAVRYEGRLATQEASNNRYNTDLYKGTNATGECRMALRKVPAGGPYHTGDSANYSSDNASKTWMTDRDYYIGIFPVTQYQYQKLYGTNPSQKTASISGNITSHRPVEFVSWDDLRLSATAATSSIPVVASNSGTFFQRLNYITGNKYGFDLPTEVMFEIAERAGATTAYYWGDVMDASYVVCRDNSGSSTVAVGSRLPNNWGLFDMAGNVWEWCLDDNVNGNLAARTDVFTPAWVSGGERRFRGGGYWYSMSSIADFRASYRDRGSSSLRYFGLGFRVAMIAY